jgi:phospholipase C
MVEIDRRRLLAGAGAGLLATSPIGRAFAIDADRRHGSLMDVEHVVILMQENRSFDHYFGSLAGVRGFGDRFPIPSATGDPRQTVWTQFQRNAQPAALAPFHLDTAETFALMCAEGTPHTWPDAQAAWDEGRMSHWPESKTVRSMGHYTREDLPFQFALAEAFTICDAYHCAIQTGTNSNRLFLWTGTNDPDGKAGGPAIGNSHDALVKDGGWPDPYRWTTYAERLHDAGIDWRIYQDMADNFTDNPLAGFKRFRDAYAAGPGGPEYDLIARGMSTQKLDRLRADVIASKLPQVSYIVSDAASSEHPAASSPAQGADYTARVLDALTANPAVWSRTVLFVMFDENDGFFDHVPPPAPPSRTSDGFAGASTVATDGEYHFARSAADKDAERDELIGRPYGLGQRVPMYVISPWSRGGWVNSQVFDHTSVIRFLEARFGVHEPNISPWRRAVCGDLTSAFDFAHPNDPGKWAALPDTKALAARAAALPNRPPAAPPAALAAPVQATGARRSRALPYALDVADTVDANRITLTFSNTGQAGAVFHVYDRNHRDHAPRRYTVEAGKMLTGEWSGDPVYDLWVLGPNGFHRQFAGQFGRGVQTGLSPTPGGGAILTVRNMGLEPRRVSVTPGAYIPTYPDKEFDLGAGQSTTMLWPMVGTGGWYDLIVRIGNDDRFLRRFAGRFETGRDSIADPAMDGAALMSHTI